MKDPPTQEYVLPRLFDIKPSPIMWLSRQFSRKHDAVWSQYFHPMYVIHTTVKKYFFEYHSRLFRQALPPEWSGLVDGNKCELYQYGKIAEAVQETRREMSPAISAAPQRRPYSVAKYQAALNQIYVQLKKTYGEKDTELLPILEQERLYLHETAGISRDERRELEHKRREKLIERLELMQKRKGHLKTSSTYSSTC